LFMKKSETCMPTAYMWKPFAMIRRIPAPSLVFLILPALFYLSQNLYTPVTSMDEAQQWDYLSRILHGKLPFRDFLDIYGPLNWIPPAVSYLLAGNQWFGVRLWMLLIQLLILGMVYRVVLLFGSRFHASSTFILGLIFVGFHTTQNYTPYAFMHGFPLTLGVLWILAGKNRPKTGGLLLAGLLTGTAIYLKISSGLFLWLGGLFVLFFSQYREKSFPISEASSEKIPLLLFMGKFILAAVYLAVFTSYILPHYERQYFWHLIWPLALGITIMLWMETKRYITAIACIHIKITK